MVKTEAPAYAKAAGNSYSLHLPLARLSSTLHLVRCVVFSRGSATYRLPKLPWADQEV